MERPRRVAHSSPVFVSNHTVSAESYPPLQKTQGRARDFRSCGRNNHCGCQGLQFSNPRGLQKPKKPFVAPISQWNDNRKESQMLEYRITNSAGLILAVLGCFLLYLFGLPPDVNPRGESAIILEEIDTQEVAKAQRYTGLAEDLESPSLPWVLCASFLRLGCQSRQNAGRTKREDRQSLPP
jgi:hypothetical protein